MRGIEKSQEEKKKIKGQEEKEVPPSGEKNQLWPMLPFSCWHLYKFLTHGPVYNPQASLQNENTCLSQIAISSL